MCHNAIEKIIPRHFHVNNSELYQDLCYEIIIDCDLIVNLGLIVDFNNNIIECYGAFLPMKNPLQRLLNPNISKREMKQIVIHTKEPYSTM